jgi:protein-disulfide isomerase
MMQDYVAEHRGGLDQMIHDYILANPGVISEALRAQSVKLALEKQVQARRGLAEDRDLVFADPGDPVIGNASGDVTIVAVTDYQCPYCKALSPTLDQLVAADSGIRLVTKEFPILGPGSEVAARYALAALRQGKYGAFHAALMSDRTPEHQLDEAKVQTIAAAVGLDVARLRADAAGAEIAAKIAGNRALAKKLGISGTPALIIGEQILGGVQSLETLKNLVSAVRARSTALAP